MRILRKYDKYSVVTDGWIVIFDYVETDKEVTMLYIKGTCVISFENKTKEQFDKLWGECNAD